MTSTTTAPAVETTPNVVSAASVADKFNFDAAEHKKTKSPVISKSWADDDDDESSDSDAAAPRAAPTKREPTSSRTDAGAARRRRNTVSEWLKSHKYVEIFFTKTTRQVGVFITDDFYTRLHKSRAVEFAQSEVDDKLYVANGHAEFMKELRANVKLQLPIMEHYCTFNAHPKFSTLFEYFQFALETFHKERMIYWIRSAPTIEKRSSSATSSSATTNRADLLAKVLDLVTTVTNDTTANPKKKRARNNDRPYKKRG
jgi:hypothetical protein